MLPDAGGGGRHVPRRRPGAPGGEGAVVEAMRLGSWQSAAALPLRPDPGFSGAQRQDIPACCTGVQESAQETWCVHTSVGAQVLRVDGGASANDLLMQLQADILQVTCCLLHTCHCWHVLYRANAWSPTGSCWHLLGGTMFQQRLHVCRCQCIDQHIRRPPRWAPHTLPVIMLQLALCPCCRSFVEQAAVLQPGTLGCMQVSASASGQQTRFLRRAWLQKTSPFSIPGYWRMWLMLASQSGTKQCSFRLEHMSFLSDITAGIQELLVSTQAADRTSPE